ncbi:uncharacterized protein RDI95_005399 [Morus bassanus]
MELEVAQKLLCCFLEKRGVGPLKDLDDLVALGHARGCFVNPSDVFDQGKWRELGDHLWDKVIDDQKWAKKLMKPWREVINDLKRCSLEKSTARQAQDALDQHSDTGKFLPGIDYNSTPSQGGPLPVKVAECVPSAPLMEDMIPELNKPEKKEYQSDSGGACNKDDWSATPPPCNPEKPEPQQQIGTKSSAIDWQKISQEAISEGNFDIANQLAFPVVYVQQNNQILGEHRGFDWKLLTQLRSTVNENGLHGEPTRQILDYIWGSMILLPEDVKRLIKLICSPSEQLLWQAHWQTLCDRSQNTPRQQGDPLYGVVAHQLMGTGAFASIDMQVQMGPDINMESMKLARQALDRVRTTTPTPSYMNIKQGVNESFAKFVDKVTAAISAALVPDFMKGALLRQCILENCNKTAKNILITLPLDSPIEVMLERMSRVPQGDQAMLIEAIQNVGRQIASVQKEVLEKQPQAFAAALAPLRSPPRPQTCFRCGEPGHIRTQCARASVWCPLCKKDNHSQKACRRSGNGKKSAGSRGARTQMAAPVQLANKPPTPLAVEAASYLPTSSSQPPQEASAWTWQLQ